MVIKNSNNRIGDFLGTIPAMIELSKTQKVDVIIHDEAKGLFNLIPKKYGINRVVDVMPDIVMDITKAFNYATTGGRWLHMIQSQYHTLGLPVPVNIPRPELEYQYIEFFFKFDYILAPFSRSLPNEELWPKEKWNELVKSMPDKTFLLFGTLQYDDINFIDAPNCTAYFDRSLARVCNLIRQSTAVISVVSGISHLCYALNKKNYLFFDQGLWGQNVDAVLFEKNIPDIAVSEVINTIKY